jgi:hypothetical protein
MRLAFRGKRAEIHIPGKMPAHASQYNSMGPVFIKNKKKHIEHTEALPPAPKEQPVPRALTTMQENREMYTRNDWWYGRDGMGAYVLHASPKTGGRREAKLSYDHGTLVR